MKPLFLLAMLLGMAGCVNSTPPDHSLEDDLATIRWNNQYSSMGNAAAASMYACISEIYATGKGGGSVCRDACSQYADIIEYSKHIPANVHTEIKGDLKMPDDYVCTGRARSKKVTP